jgi:hypothetical protein
MKLVDSHKILGLIFDKRLDWLAHINYIKAIASKRVNILKCKYVWHLRNLKKLDAFDHNGIRTALGAFRSSRVENIMCETRFTNLSHRRERQIANSAVRMKSIKNHQISKLIEDRTRNDSYSAKPRSTKPGAQDVCGRLDIEDTIQKIAYS